MNKDDAIAAPTQAAAAAAPTQAAAAAAEKGAAAAAEKEAAAAAVAAAAAPTQAATTIKPDAASARAVLEGAFLKNTHEINEEQLLGRTLYLVTGDATVVGLVKSDGNYITALAVSHDFRRQGYGTQLVAAIAHQLEGNMVYVQADVTATEFYKSCGFTDEDVPFDSDKDCVAMKAQRTHLLTLRKAGHSSLHFCEHTFDRAEIPPPDSDEPGDVDYTFPNGQTWKGGLDGDAKPCGSGRLTKDGTATFATSMDSEGHELDGDPFVKNGRSGFLKFYAMSGKHQGTYELQYQNDSSAEQEFVSAAEAFKLHVVPETSSDEDEDPRGPCRRKRSELGDDAADPYLGGESTEEDEQMEADPVTGVNVEELCGSGGCTAHALWKLGVCLTQATATALLNDMGERLYRKRCEENGGSYDKARVYTAGDNWCSEVIKLAVIRAEKNFHKLDLRSRDVSLQQELKRGTFLIDGVQNRYWTKLSNEYTNAPTYTGPGPEQDANSWRHSIAVKDGRVLEQNEDVFTAKWLWLQDDNRPDVTKGYMREVLKVYRITPQDDDDAAERPNKRARADHL
eukprot:COSAG02_NODE_2378_length_9005_cov_4.989782_4_plen_567_part_00